MTYLKEQTVESMKLKNIKFQTSLAYTSSSSYIYIEKFSYSKSNSNWKQIGRIDFSVAEATALIKLLTNTYDDSEYIYPTNSTKFVTKISNNIVTVTKLSLRKAQNELVELNTILVSLQEMPSVIYLLCRAMTFSSIIYWGNIEPIIKPTQPSCSVQDVINEILKGTKK